MTTHHHGSEEKEVWLFPVKDTAYCNQNAAKDYSDRTAIANSVVVAMLWVALFRKAANVGTEHTRYRITVLYCFKLEVSEQPLQTQLEQDLDVSDVKKHGITNYH